MVRLKSGLRRQKIRPRAKIVESGGDTERVLAQGQLNSRSRVKDAGTGDSVYDLVFELAVGETETVGEVTSTEIDADGVVPGVIVAAKGLERVGKEREDAVILVEHETVKHFVAAHLVIRSGIGLGFVEG